MSLLDLKRDKPICFIDLETTGTNTSFDRIVSIAIIKIFPDGAREEKTALVNPERPIPREASAIHGIKDGDVINQPTFKKYSKSIYRFIADSDIGGYNSNNYDILILAEEFLRCNIDFPLEDTRMIDVMNIFKNKEKRDLETAYRFYCGKTMKNAHDALCDIQTTVEIFEMQLQRYPELKKGMDYINDFCKYDNRVDLAGKIILDEDGDYAYGFGNVKGVKIKEDFRVNGNKAFCFWMMNKDFTMNTKRTIQKIIVELIHLNHAPLPDFEEFNLSNHNRIEGQKSLEFKYNPNYNGEDEAKI